MDDQIFTLLRDDVQEIKQSCARIEERLITQGQQIATHEAQLTNVRLHQRALWTSWGAAILAWLGIK